MTGLGRMLAGIAGVALLAVGPAWATGGAPAQDSKAPATNDLSGVTVTAPEKPNPLVNPETQFVRGHLARNRNEQYARFRDPVCVRVIGLPPEFDAFIARRVVEMANQVKAPVDKSPTCAPNVNVIFTPNPQAQLDDIAKRRDILFGFYFKADAKKISTFSRPIQAWYLTRARGTDGRDILELYDPAPCISSPQGVCDIKSPAVKGRAGSRLGNDMSTELVHSLILADAAKVADEKIGAVADYVAVLALARWQGLERCNAIPTILNLLADGCSADAVAETATADDLGLLKGLYMVDPREAGSLQRMTIAGRMETEAKKDSGEESPPMRRRLLATLAATSLAAATTALAATGGEPPASSAAPATDLSGVTVTGEKKDPLVDKTTQFVRGHLAENRNQQYARFHDPVCVRVLGLPPQFDAFIARRVVTLAQEVKAPVDRSPTCRPNVNVVFTPKPQALLDDIAKRRDILFGFHMPAETKKISTFTRTIQSWYLTRAVDTNGNSMLELYDPAPCQSTGMPGAPPCDLKAPPLMGKAGSRLGNDMSTELVHALILADSTKVVDAKIGALADYVAVLALARWDGLEKCNAVPTILNLMADSCEAEDVTEATPADLGLLTGLYSVNPRESGTQQRVTIADRLATELKKSQQGEAH